MPNLNKRIENANGFTVLGYDLVFKGICGECQSKETESIKERWQ